MIKLFFTIMPGSLESIKTISRMYEIVDITSGSSAITQRTFLKAFNSFSLQSL